jgi:conserved oligomeric Golgi complex subunit 3
MDMVKSHCPAFVQAFLREEVKAYKPSAADLDYPACLASRWRGAAAADASGAGKFAGDDAPPADPPTPDAASGPVAPPDEDAASWYPPLRQTLVCLARLYRSVELPAFANIGQDALRMCSGSILAAANVIAARESPLDGHLFAIRHLLLLREQISPFQADFRETDRDLDFAHMRGQLQQVLEGKLPIFALSRNSAVVQMVTAGGVRVLESDVDSKQELEKALKAACEALIMAATKLVVEPLLSFLHKVAAAKAAAEVRSVGPRAAPLARPSFCHF